METTVLLTGGGGAAGASTPARTCRPINPATTTPPKQQQQQEEEEGEVRRGPWTVDEDLTLINYIAAHGDGRWNALARAAGLKRTGKSCRLRWLNYLRPDVNRGDFTAQEQMLILELHSRWGNRWSKIAQQLPGRTDNEIKNYWRTRVQKHARQLNCDVNSRRFRDAMTYLWMPRLAERAAHHSSVVLDAASPSSSSLSTPAATTTTTTTVTTSCCLQADTNNTNNSHHHHSPGGVVVPSSSSSDSSLTSTSTEEDQKRSVHDASPYYYGGGDDADLWTTTMQAAGAEHNEEFCWSTTTPAPLTTSDVDLLTGWVQGFSDVDSGSALWSLDDIWRMQ